MPTSPLDSSWNHRAVCFVLLLVSFCATAGTSSSAQSLATLATFTGSNGIQPWSLIQGSDGNFYGIAQFGGNLSGCGGSGCGLVFKMTPSGALTVIYAFSGPDGEAPEALVQGVDGNLYGTTFCTPGNGDQKHRLLRPDGLRRRTVGSTPPPANFCEGGGTAFKLTLEGTLTTLQTFAGPGGGLLQASAGTFYGTTGAGGLYGWGTIYQMSPTGALTTLYNFTGGADGAYPFALVAGTDGDFYGTTFGNGTDNQGTVFKITPSGTLITLHAFAGVDGARPLGAMVQATDGNFYGTTAGGGLYDSCLNNDCGTVFRISPEGGFTKLYNFSGGSDGSSPVAGLIQATDGNIYGTTEDGAEESFTGTIFRVTTSGMLTTVYNFCSQPGCTDGASPEGGPLFEGGNGLLYGTTYYGGDTANCDAPSGCGTVFSLSAAVNPTPKQFVPVTECRLVDTRQTGTPVAGGTWQVFPIPQLGECDIPASAIAYSLNVTVVPHGQLGYLTVWPAGTPQPSVSTLNSLDGRVKANAAIVQAGASAAVSVYASDTTDVILDINGYFTAPGAQTLQFYPLTPCRIVDTRNGQDGGTLQAGMERDYAMTGTCGIPAGAEAYSLNVTVLPAAGGLDYLTVWPQGEPMPGVSTLNDPTGTVVANAAILPSGSNQTVAFYPNSNNTDLLVDINGYFASAGAGGSSFYLATPCRAYDSRNNNGQPFQGERTVPIANSPCAPPAMAAGYVFNATVVPRRVMPYLTVWPDSEPQPLVSTLNAYDGYITSNMAIVPNINGNIDAYAAGLTQLIIDLYGYFAP